MDIITRTKEGLKQYGQGIGYKKWLLNQRQMVKGFTEIRQMVKGRIGSSCLVPFLHWVKAMNNTFIKPTKQKKMT